MIKARNLLNEHESAVVVRTDGRNLQVGKPEGSTAWWVLRASAKPDKVIIYHLNSSRREADIYWADYAGKSQREKDRRYKLLLSNIQWIGTTELTWHEFADAKPGARNPIRYISG